MSGQGIDFKGFVAYPDGSGAPVTADVYGDTYSFDFLGELKSRGLRVRPAHGNKARGMRDSALKKAKRAYLDKVKKLGPEWLKKNLEMYPGGKGLGEEMELIEKAPPGWSGTVKAMKKHMPDEKAFALAWDMYKKGAKPHYKSTGSTKSEQEPELKKKYQEGMSGQLAAALASDGIEEAALGRPTISKACVKILEKGAAPSMADAKKLADVINKTGKIKVVATKAGKTIDLLVDGQPSKPALSVGPNNVVWYVWQGKREQPMGFVSDVLKVASQFRVEQGYPEFTRGVPWPQGDPWFMAKKIDPNNPAIPEAVRKAKQEDISSEEFEGLLDEGSKSGKEFKVGDIVRYTGKFLRNIGMQTGAPINGKIVGFVTMGGGRKFPKVLWNDRDEPIAVSPTAIEHDPKFKRKGVTHKPDYFESIDDLFEAELEESVSLPADIMAISNYVVSKEANVSESELMRRFRLTRTWAKKILALGKRAFRGAGIPRADMKRAQANPGRYFRELVLPVLEKLQAAKMAAAQKKSEGQVEDLDELFNDALEEGLLTEKGKHYYDGKDYYADTAFLNSLRGVMKGMELKHMGFGEFSLEGDGKTIEFDRMRGKKFPGQSGRSHKVYDNQGGKLVKELIGKMEKGDKSELVKEGIELDESVSLPKKGDAPLEIKAHGKVLAVKKSNSGPDWVMTLGSRVRWGNKAQTLADVDHFKQMGALPPKQQGWESTDPEGDELTEAQWSDALDLCKKVTDGLPQLRKKHFFCRFGAQYATPQVIVEYADVPKGAKGAEVINNPKQVKFVVLPFEKNGDAAGDLRVKVHYSNQKDIGFRPMRGSVDEVAKHLVRFLKRHDAEKGAPVAMAASMAVRLDAALHEAEEDWTDLSVFSTAGGPIEEAVLTERQKGPPAMAATDELTSRDPELVRELQRAADQTRRFVRSVYHMEEVAADLAHAAQETERIRRTTGVERAMQRSPLGNAARAFEAEAKKVYGPFAEGRNAMMRVAKMARISTRRTGKKKAPSVPTGEITATSLVRDVLQVTAKLGATIRESAELGSVAIREAEKLLNQKSVISGDKLQDRLSAFVQVYLDFRDQVSSGLFKMIAAVVRRMNEMTRRLMKMWEQTDHGLYLISLPWSEDPDFEQTWEDEDIVISDEGMYPQSIGWLEAVA